MCRKKKKKYGLMIDDNQETERDIIIVYIICYI